MLHLSDLRLADSTSIPSDLKEVFPMIEVFGVELQVVADLARVEDHVGKREQIHS